MTETKYFAREITLSPRSKPPGAKFPGKIAYWTFGSASHPAVVLPSCFGGDLATTTSFLYSSENGNADPPLPPSKFFIVVLGQMGGGESASPSNTPSPWNGPNFPHLTYEDNIRLQHTLLTEELGLEKVFAYIGFSMGGQQAYHMASLFPDFVDNAVCLAGSARTSQHNWSFLEGPRLALETSHDFQDGHYAEQPACGIKAFNRVYATWALCPEWFRRTCWDTLGFATLQDYLEAEWTHGLDANDALRLLWMWQDGDIAVYHPEDQGSLPKALGRIKARVLVMPSRTDMYFPPEDSQEEVTHLKRGELRVIESIWGHMAGGGGGTRADDDYVKAEIKRFLLEPGDLKLTIRE